MEITTIDWLAGSAIIIALLTIWVIRYVQKPKSPESHIGFAAGGAFALGAAVKASYPIIRFFYYKSIDGIPGLWLYVVVGCAAAVVLGLVGFVKSLKAT